MSLSVDQAEAAPDVQFQRGPRRRCEAILVALALLVTGWFHYFTVETSGALRTGAVNFDYYNLLVDGFREGHLYLPIEPNPALMALPDPYDPVANEKLRVGDMSYYDRHYYIYFGITPAAVLMLPYTAITGRHMPQAAAVLVFCLIGVVAASALWLGIRRRYFSNSAVWMAPLGVLVIGLGTHVLALARRPSVWETPISASFAFTMLMLLCVYWALHGKRPVLAMALAALSLGLAVGARPTSLVTVGVLALGVWGLARRQADRTWLRAGGAAVAVLGAIGAVLAWYNYARFGSVAEFGQDYQLTGLNERVAHHFNPRFIAYNLWMYFAWPVQWTSDFPFIASRPLPPWPSGYFSGEELYCLALLFPVMWFAAIGAMAWRRGTAGLERGFAEAIRLVLAIFFPMALVMLCFFYAAERYMVDFVPTLMLLGLCGALIVERAASTIGWRCVGRTSIALAAVVTASSGVLASFDYHGRSMRDSAPETWRAIAAIVEPPVQTVVHWFSRASHESSGGRP